MKRSDWLSNKSPVKPGTVDSVAWSAIADAIAKDLFEITRFVKVCKADKSSVRLMLGAMFYDATRNKVLDRPRPNVIYNVIGEVLDLNPKCIKVKVYTMDTALAYEFSWVRNKLTRKQVK